jgi:stage III sporulation protein AG
MNEDKKQKLLDKFPFLKKFKDNKKLQVLFGVFVLCILMLVYLNFNKSNNTSTSSTISTSAEYVNSLENKLSNILSEVSGAGKVNVIVTLESGSQIVVASSKEERTNTSTNGSNKTESITVNETPVIITSTGGSTPLILMEILPKIKGVLVVAQGASDMKIKLELIRAVQAVLDVPSDNIEIFAGK